MWPTFLSLLLALSHQAPQRPAPRRRPAFRRPVSHPRVEALEDRCVPSTAGSLDTSFNPTGNPPGTVTTSLPLPSTNDLAYVPLIQPDGKIVVTGEGSNGPFFSVVRYNTDGSLDTSFGSGGIAEANFGNAIQYVQAAALYPQAGNANDGKILLEGSSIVIVGTKHNFTTVDELNLVRFNANGTLDTTFGTGGEVLTRFSIGSVGSRGVVITNTGKIVAVGDNGSDYVLARYNADGSLDSTFGQGGEVITTFPTGAYEENLAQQPDGKLVVVGETSVSGAWRWQVVRYNADGTLDTSFGSDGIVDTADSTLPNTKAVAIYPNAGTANDGKIVVAGTGEPGSFQEFAVLRYNPDGSLDTTWGGSGEVTTSISGIKDEAYGVAIQSDGKVVVAGQSAINGNEFALTRYNTDGSLDSAFGTNGIVTTAIGTSSDGFGVALQPNGDIVVAGIASNSSNKLAFAVARYLGATVASPSFSVTGFPSATTAGVANTITVTAEDASGNPNPGYTGTVHFTSSDPQAVLPADYAFTAADLGEHTFSVMLKTAGSQSITATDTVMGSPTGSESGIVVQPAAAARFTLSPPGSVTKGAAFGLTLTVEDVYGNVVTGYVGTVHFTSSDSTATLPANYTFTAADAGVHTFTNAFILKKRSTQTITVTDTKNSALTDTDDIDVT